MKTAADLVAPCGLYCGVCGVYFATSDDNRKFLEKLVNIYKSNSRIKIDLNIKKT